MSFFSATNLNDALLTAVRMLVKERKDGNLPERSTDMIILLTDGMPNHGELSQLGGLYYFILRSPSTAALNMLPEDNSLLKTELYENVALPVFFLFVCLVCFFVTYEDQRKNSLNKEGVFE